MAPERQAPKLREARNLTGNNQHGGSWVQREPSIPDWIQEYLNKGKSVASIVESLRIRLGGTGPKKRTVEKIIHDHELTTSRSNEMTDEEAGAYILHLLEEDNVRRTGYRWVHDMLRKRGIHMPRDFVAFFLRQLEPELVDARYGGKKKTVHTGRLTCPGPNYEWSCDGHDKLIPEMDIGVWGVIDKSSRNIFRYYVVPTYKRADIVAALYLLTVKQQGGFPFQLSMDKGSETNLAAAAQIILTLEFDPRDIDAYPCYRGLKSVYNISIEKEWRPFFDKCLENILIEWRKGIPHDGFHPENDTHRQIARWVWSKVVQKATEEYVENHNTHRIRHQETCQLPTGGTPEDFYNLPQNWGNQNYMRPVAMNVVDDLLEQQIPADIFQWADPPIEAHCQAVYTALGRPPFTVKTAWIMARAIIAQWPVYY